jgi:hypothetical protein
VEYASFTGVRSQIIRKPYRDCNTLGGLARTGASILTSQEQTGAAVYIVSVPVQLDSEVTLSAGRYPGRKRRLGVPISDDQIKWEAWEYLLTLSEAQLAAMGAPPNTVTAEYDVTELDHAKALEEAFEYYVVERLRNVWNRALAKGDKSLSVGRAKFRNMKRALEMLVAFDPTFANKGLMDIWLEMGAAVENGSDLGAGRYKLPHNPFPEHREEADVLQEAWPDLSKLARYERRALSRRKRDLSAFIDLKCSVRLRKILGKSQGLRLPKGSSPSLSLP